MNSRVEIGRIGEDLAIDFLEHQGFHLLERNYRCGRGEIDIIVIKEGLLVFAEVKTRSHPYQSFGIDMVRWDQQQKIMETAERYLGQHYWEGLIRYDVLVVSLGRGQSVQHLPGYFS